MCLRPAIQGWRTDRRARRLANRLVRLRPRCSAGQLNLDLGQADHADLQTYIEPGIWFGDVAIFDGDRRTHDAYAHGETVLLCVARGDFQKILANHIELYEALMRLQARRIRQLFGLVEDLNTLPLRARLAKQLLHLARSYGVPTLADGSEVRIGLQLAQEELAQLLGASRQRVNQELKSMEREDIIRIEPGGLVVRSRDALARIAEANV
jgi:CRP/FNR family transcriptional regulator, cyclic AMP receptor protein